MYGCEIASVCEIIPFQRATRLPGAPSFVHGLINLRGTIVTVLDLGRRLDPTHPVVTDGAIVLLDIQPRSVGLAVDEVMDVQQIVEEAVAVAVGDVPSGLVRGLGHLGDDAIVILLDIHELVNQVLLRGGFE